MSQLTKEQTKLVEENLNLVYFVVNSKWKKFFEIREDLEQEGFLALCKASQTYDPTRGKFSTYAVIYIDGYIKKYLGYKDPYFVNLKNNVKHIESYISIQEDKDYVFSPYELADNKDEFLSFINYNHYSNILSISKDIISEDELKFLINYVNNRVLNNRKKYKNDNRKYHQLIRKLKMFYRKNSISLKTLYSE